MSWTKREFVMAAFAEIGYAEYSFDLEPEQLQLAMRRMDAMMGTWNGRGIRIGYPIPNDPTDNDLDEDTGVPDAANEAIYTNLAIRIAPTIGKAVSQETKAAALSSYSQLLSRSAKPSERQLHGYLPLGSGNKTYRYRQPFVDPPIDKLLTGEDGELEFN